MSKSKLEVAFDAAMMEIYVRAKTEAGYTSTIFHKMLLEKRGIATAKQLINATTVFVGYTALWERGRLDLTVEAEVHDNERWHVLFGDDELKRVKKRLLDYGYFE